MQKLKAKQGFVPFLFSYDVLTKTDCEKLLLKEEKGRHGFLIMPFVIVFRSKVLYVT